MTQIANPLRHMRGVRDEDEPELAREEHEQDIAENKVQVISRQFRQGVVDPAINSGKHQLTNPAISPRSS